MFRYNIKYLQSVCLFVPLALDFKSEPSDEDIFWAIYSYVAAKFVSAEWVSDEMAIWDS